MVTGNKQERTFFLEKIEDIEQFRTDALAFDAVKDFIATINQEIGDYHQTRDHQQKIDALKNIKSIITAFNAAFPRKSYASSPGYLALHEKLLDAVQSEVEGLGITTLSDAGQAPDSINEIISNMSQLKLNKFMEVLRFGKFFDIDELKELYEENDNRPEAKNFRSFLQNNEISFLGGSNSKNFKILCLSDQSRLVLKVEDNKNPKIFRAKETLGTHLSPIHSERMAQSNVYGKSELRSVQVGNFYSTGSLREWTASFESSEKRLDASINISQQMASIFLDLEKAGTFFPDAKLENWVLSDEQKLLIADSKSLVPTEQQEGNIVYKPDMNHTTYMTIDHEPPEFNLSNLEKTVDVDPIHSFLLGKNIYNFLSKEIVSGDNGAEFDFTADVFQSDKGQKLQSLIGELVKPEASKRLAVTEAMHQLFLIQHPNFEPVLKELKTFAFGQNDREIDNYLQAMQNELRNEPDKEADILKNMQAMLDDLKQNTSMNQVRDSINDFRKKAGLFSIGMNQKAERIEQAMSKIPLNDRLNLYEKQNTPAVKNLMEAIASHRHPHKRPDKSQTKSFQAFKSKYSESTRTSNGKSEAEPDEPPSGPGYKK